MNWYLTLDINKKINAKECFGLLCGIKFEQLASLFTFRERIEIMYQKLKLEGFNV